MESLITQGAAGASQTLTGSLERFRVWCVSPNAFSQPAMATGVNVKATGSLKDVSQKNFELLVQSVSLRATPVLLETPNAVEELSNHGSQQVTGEGFVWCFGTEGRDFFRLGSNAAGLLTKEIDGIVLSNGTVIKTHGAGQNIEFRQEVESC